MQEASVLFRLLGDTTRLRLLRVLDRDRFNVTELTGILALAQSGVSRHLSLLRDAGLVIEERQGGYAYYQLRRDNAPGTVTVWPLLDAQFVAADDTLAKADDTRLQEVLRLRKENFETHGDQRQLVPGRSWAAWARALGHLLPPLDVVDIGCGEGYLTLEAARWARSVVGVDRSDAVLDRARGLAERRHVTNAQWKKGDLLRLPLPDASVDVALLSQTLHHAHHADDALKETARVLRPGGRVLVLDLREHAETWVRDRFGDARLGFTDDDLRHLMAEAGFDTVQVNVGTRQAGDPFVVLIASGTKPGQPATAARRPSRRRGSTMVRAPARPRTAARTS